MFIFPSSMTIFMQFINSRFGSKKENQFRKSCSHLINYTNHCHPPPNYHNSVAGSTGTTARRQHNQQPSDFHLFFSSSIFKTFVLWCDADADLDEDLDMDRLDGIRWIRRKRQTATDKLPDAVRWRSVSFQSCAEDDDHYDHCVTSFWFSVSFLKSRRHTHTHTKIAISS